MSDKASAQPAWRPRSFLTDKMRSHLERKWSGVSLDTQAVYVDRVKECVRLALADLTLVASTLSEKDLAEIFSAEYIEYKDEKSGEILLLEETALMNFIDALVKTQWTDSKERKERVRLLCQRILKLLAPLHFVLAREASDILASGERDRANQLLALLIGH